MEKEPEKPKRRPCMQLGHCDFIRDGDEFRCTKCRIRVKIHQENNPPLQKPEQ